MIRLFWPVKSPFFTLFLLTCALLLGCHLDDIDGSKAGVLNELNHMEAINIAQEKAGAPPPKGSATWREYWHSRFVIMQGVEDSGTFSHIGRENIAFIRRRRAEAGLPPVD